MNLHSRAAFYEQEMGAFTLEAVLAHGPLFMHTRPVDIGTWGAVVQHEETLCRIEALRDYLLLDPRLQWTPWRQVFNKLIALAAVQSALRAAIKETGRADTSHGNVYNEGARAAIVNFIADLSSLLPKAQ